jgi:hypothetical protein
MSFRFITKSIHAYLIDYPAAIVLIAAPFVLKIGRSGPVAMWLSVGDCGGRRVRPHAWNPRRDGRRSESYRGRYTPGSFLIAPMVEGLHGASLRAVRPDRAADI